MRVLNIEDDTFKHNDICKALSECGIKDVEWSNNLADGWKQIKNSMDSNNPYDLIITDMYYPGEIYGCVYYSRERNWEADMQKLVNSLVAG